MISEDLKKAIEQALDAVGIDHSAGPAFAVEHPDELSHGDYATNAALVFSKVGKTSPRQLAERLVAALEKKMPRHVEAISIAGPGFINFSLNREFFVEQMKTILKEENEFGRGDFFKKGGVKKGMVEYTQPNPFKEFHIGHLMNNAIGESLSRLAEAGGVKVARATYHGDVGLHVAKTVWALKKDAMPVTVPNLGAAYAKGNTAYETDEAAKAEITALNRHIYDRTDAGINRLYDEGRKASLDHFERLYKRLGSSFDFHFYESEAGKIGRQIVLDALEKGIFEKSEGAVVFHGENYGLHTRVFLNKEGLPTYEAKEVGLSEMKREAFAADRYLTVTANEQDDFFKVAEKAISEIFKGKRGDMLHVSHGVLRLPTGKMSSRTGTIVAAEAFIDGIKSSVLERIADRGFSDAERDVVSESVAQAAIRYAILRQTLGADVIFDPAKSISFEGDSGPYLQYAAVRAGSVAGKAKAEKVKPSTKNAPAEAYAIERILYRLPEVVERAAYENEPHFLVTYLTELAGSFNNFYAHNKIVAADDAYSAYKVALAAAFVHVMKNGLNLLGISVPERM